ncbi:5-formyltetrahydrofolate cyclo-ligase [Thiocapsa sp. KS1]|nr:5-formyltetrahydrofolate cyclo-ligase [Thiocapsa sp. KS1]CRI65142.1 5-formyltetrahydrofolate cyclo-ligase [Thiocapsa sp. KS1]
MSALKSLRRTLRDSRRSLSARCQRAHARRVCGLLRRDARFLRARRIAAYWPTDGELDPLPLVHQALERGKAAYLPILGMAFGREGRAKLRFARYLPRQRMRPNRFGIPEPGLRGRHVRPVRDLDLILMPLVGFDSNGNRIGMGGGFYDRTLAYLKTRRHWRRPRLIGLAHECQRLETIVPNPWDIPLDAVVTELRIYFRSRPER